MPRHRRLVSAYRSQGPWLIAAFIACIGAGAMIYFWRAGRPLWVDEEMLALNARDRSFTALIGPLWLGQAAPLGWLALEHASMLTVGLSERAVRAVPVLWGLLTLAAAVWVGRRWLGPVGAAVLALLCAFGNHIWFFALELKQYSADTFGGMWLPSLAAWAIEPSTDESPRVPRRADAWWIIAGVMQWFSYGALFVAPGCGAMLVALTWRRAGRRAALRTAALSVFWLFCVGLHYYLGIRHASSSAYLREYWTPAFPPVGAGAAGTLRWFGDQFDLLSNIPGGTSYSASFWIIAAAGLTLGVRNGSALALMLATVAPSAFLLAALQLVPLSGRLSLWMLPSLYSGIALAADEGIQALKGAVVRKRWLAATGALICSLFVARLCADIYRIGELEIKTRLLGRSAHGVDDRSAIRSLMTQRRPGDAMLVTHLGLPAVWWYAGVDLSDASQGASFSDGGPIFEIWHAKTGRDCRLDDLKDALNGVGGATMYLGFALPDHLADLVLNRLAELGAVTTYRRFAERGHAAVIDLRKAPTGRILLPQRTDPRIRPQGCVTIKRARRW